MKKTYLTVTDQFCGAGGSSQGVRMVDKNIEVAVALNHWKLAIETHSTNFPNAIHDCTDISACDPRRYPSTDILITSPECTNHSLAKGQKSVRLQALILIKNCFLLQIGQGKSYTGWKGQKSLLTSRTSTRSSNTWR